MESLALADVRFAAIDFEGAGELPGHTDVPIQIGIAECQGLQAIEPSLLYRSFLATDRPVALAARQIHGISETDLEGAPELLSLWPELKKRLGQRVLVAHNAGVERRYLRAFPGHGFGPWIDTLVLARKFYPTLKSHSLGSVLEDLQLTAQVAELCPDFGWHDALFDAVAALVFLRHVIDAAGLHQRPLATLLNL